MTPTGKSNRHCFMNAYLAAIPWQSTPSLFLRCRAPGEPRPTPCAIASAQPPILPPCAHPVQPASSTPGHWPPSLLRSPSALTGVSPPPPERALAPGPPSPPRPGIRACRLVFVPFLPPHWVNLTNQECPFLSGYLTHHYRGSVATRLLLWAFHQHGQSEIQEVDPVERRHYHDWTKGWKDIQGAGNPGRGSRVHGHFEGLRKVLLTGEHPGEGSNDEGDDEEEIGGVLILLDQAVFAHAN